MTSIVRDYLSQLPEDLIINILSKMDLKDSGRTSVLSRRWRNLWLLTTHCSGPNLIFRNPIYGLLTFTSCADSDRKRVLYIDLLNKVFKLHQHPLLDELVINCYLSSKYSTALDNWIEFAFAKGVQRFELAVQVHNAVSRRPYAFPLMHNEHFRLRELCLTDVFIDQRILDGLLSKCPLLESLSLFLWGMEDLNVSSAKLKRLDLFPYDSTKGRFEIFAPSLVAFIFRGSASVLHFKCVPCLTELHVWDKNDFPFFMIPDVHLSYVSQLKKLKILQGCQMYSVSRSYPTTLPKLLKLEEFEVDFIGFDGDSFLWTTLFIKASPFLLRFCAIMDTRISSTRLHTEEEKGRIKEATKFRHQFLKVVEIRNFGGWSSEIELAQHLIDIGAQSLEKVIIDTRSPRKYNSGNEDIKNMAQSLNEGLESSVDLVVL